MKSSKEGQISVDYSTDFEDFKNNNEEKETFFYTSKINAARNFSKHL